MRYGSAFLFFLVGTSAAWAQSVISARSGVIHYIEGDVAIDGDSIHPKFAEFPEVKSGQVLATQEGRAEMLLTPGVFLRLAENSSVRMLSNSLADTRIAVISGSALIEAGELLPNNAVSFEFQGSHIAIPKKGLYRFDSDTARFEVFDGQALVTLDNDKVIAKKGHQVTLAGESLKDEKFDPKETDAFYRWSARRTEYIAAANVTAAHVASDSNYHSSLFSRVSSWTWNPWFGMFTFVPGSGIYGSPFGSTFYSPGVVDYVYTWRRPLYGGTGLGYLGTPAGRIGAPMSMGTSPRPTFGARPGMSGPRSGGYHGGMAGGMGPGHSGTRGR